MLGVGGGGIAPSGETTCDGIDDDGNGIIDDVDVGGDGVCDCLNIATIGRLGLWSTGTGIFTTWIGARSPLGVTALDNQDLTTVNLAQFQVIVVLNVVSYDWKGFGGKGEMGVASHQYSAAESDALASWVRNGGGLLTTIGYTTKTVEPADINRLLTSLDVGYDTVGVWNVDGFITNWAPHPVTQGILKIKTDVGAGPDIVLHPSLTPIAWDPTNTITLAVEEFGSGHIAMWGDEWITYDSEWKNLTDEQVERLWLNLFSWLSPANQCQVPIPPTVF
jgi:hypothetical protein